MKRTKGLESSMLLVGRAGPLMHSSSFSYICVSYGFRIVCRAVIATKCLSQIFQDTKARFSNFWRKIVLLLILHTATIPVIPSSFLGFFLPCLFCAGSSRGHTHAGLCWPLAPVVHFLPLPELHRLSLSRPLIPGLHPMLEDWECLCSASI